MQPQPRADYRMGCESDCLLVSVYIFNIEAIDLPRMLRSVGVLAIVKYNVTFFAKIRCVLCLLEMDKNQFAAVFDKDGIVFL